jgi:hypothetical protein
MTPVEKLRQKRSEDERNSALQKLKIGMSADGHLTDAEDVSGLIEKADKYWSNFTDTERDYIRLARYALVNQTTWKL